ncbi:GPI-GlcNAc transferase complex, PIG-H component, conserved domain [Phaffia rhodozyma]|uniref:GPI-GlcNAc transferase complex, PIG-H component, conserved domain n=1 Tax=Phaffia rhodozyma TaxID=264483 RepID=A0A0F7SJG0_PHARH|nr:GPI-GlcNAc transferase complex, PIG-H component, conserved domain [Phaffia rhodozyma]
MPIPNLGILLTSRSRSLLAPTPIENERLFIPMEDVEHIVINEALSRFSVIGFLEILRRKGREHIVVFPTLLPPTKSIIPIYQDLQIIISSKS